MLRLAAAAALAALPAAALLGSMPAAAQDGRAAGEDQRPVAEDAAAQQPAAEDAAGPDSVTPDGAPLDGSDAEGRDAAAAAALEAAIREAARWGPVAESLGLGTGICLGSEKIVCALVLCEEGALTFGVLGTVEGGELPAFLAQVSVDGRAFERDMQSRAVMDGSYYARTPTGRRDPLWQQLRAGNTLALASSVDGEPIEYPLRGSAAELDRVAAACR